MSAALQPRSSSSGSGNSHRQQAGAGGGFGLLGLGYGESPVENGIPASPGFPCCLHSDSPQQQQHQYHSLRQPSNGFGGGGSDAGGLLLDGFGPGSGSPALSMMIDPDDPGDAVRLSCSSGACGQTMWTHLDCLNRWERAIQQASSGSQKSIRMGGQQQQQQQLLRCSCGRGHLNRDPQQQQQHVISSSSASQPQVISRRRAGTGGAAAAAAASATSSSMSAAAAAAAAAASGVPGGSANGFAILGAGSYSPTAAGGSGADFLNRRFRHVSNSSSNHAFSLSPPSGADTAAASPGAPSGASALPFSSPLYSQHRTSHHHQQQQQQQQLHQSPHHLGSHQQHLPPRNRGNIFRRRLDNFDSLKALPKNKQNKFHIVTEDDTSTENDELKALVLATLTANRSPRVPCLLCATQLIVYDHFPLIDGTFFLSPIRHQADSPACGKGYLHAVCMQCACGSQVRSQQQQQQQQQRSVICRSCKRAWDGSHLLIGGVYLFDIFACTPCCPERLLCGNCHRPAVGEHKDLPAAFSHFSQPLACPHCRKTDFHFVKPASQIFRSAAQDASVF